MTVNLTLKEIQERCANWTYFCNQEDWDEWSVAEGGGDVEVVLTEEKAIKYGLIETV